MDWDLGLTSVNYCRSYCTIVVLVHKLVTSVAPPLLHWPQYILTLENFLFEQILISPFIPLLLILSIYLSIYPSISIHPSIYLFIYIAFVSITQCWLLYVVISSYNAPPSFSFRRKKSLSHFPLSPSPRSVLVLFSLLLTFSLFCGPYIIRCLCSSQNIKLRVNILRFSYRVFIKYCS